MPKLIVTRRAEVVSEFNLNKAQTTFTIGSESDNDLIIDDKLISMNHVHIERRGNHYYIKDLNSAFGTTLNDRRIDTTEELHNGDQFKIGDHALIFDNPLENVKLSYGEGAEETASTESGDESVVLRANPAKVEALENAIRNESMLMHSGGTNGSDSALPYYLLAIYGPYRGKRFQLKQPDTKVGRDENLNDIILDKNKNGEPDQSISRRHATISFRDNSFFVSDKRSKTRTRINNDTLTSDGEIEIFPKDEIEIVSDQQSTIFRLVEEGDNDFRPPRKAGVWWVRYRSHFATLLALIGICAGAFLLIDGFKSRSLLLQKPDPFSIELSYWSTDKSITLHGSVVDNDIATNIPAVADFNGDGFVDIATTNITNKPLLIDGRTRRPRWIIDSIPVDNEAAFIAADMNQDDLPDLVYLGKDGRLVAIDGKHGAEIWVSPFFNTRFIGPPVVGDFNGDGLKDVAIADIAGTVHTGINQVLDMEWRTISTGIPILSSLSCSDLDNDGDDEIVSGSERGLLFILDGGTETIAGTIDINEELNRALGTFYEDNQIRHPVGIADLNGDDRQELVLTTVQGRLIVIDGSTNQRLWHAVLLDELSLSSNASYPFGLGDLDGDGLTDIVASADNGSIKAFSGAGVNREPKLLWQVKGDDSATLVQSFAIGDINKDRRADVVHVDQSGLLHILDGSSGEDIAGNVQPTNIQTSMPLAADLRSDGLLDLFLVTRSGLVFQYKTNSKVPRGFVLWSQQFGRPDNTMNASFEIPRTLSANLSIMLGLLMFLGGGTTTYLYQRKKRL